MAWERWEILLATRAELRDKTCVSGEDFVPELLMNGV